MKKTNEEKMAKLAKTIRRAAYNNNKRGSKKILVGEKIMRYQIQDREAGNFISGGMTLEEARAKLKSFESQDKAEGNYEEDFYEIVEEENWMDQVKEINKKFTKHPALSILKEVSRNHRDAIFEISLEQDVSLMQAIDIYFERMEEKIRDERNQIAEVM